MQVYLVPQLFRRAHMQDGSIQASLFYQQYDSAVYHGLLHTP